MTPEELDKIKEELDKVKNKGIDVLRLPKVYDEISLFDYVATLMLSLSSALGNPTPTYRQISDAAKKVRSQFKF